jgi:hypothetical protein
MTVIRINSSLGQFDRNVIILYMRFHVFHRLILRLISISFSDQLFTFFLGNVCRVQLMTSPGTKNIQMTTLQIHGRTLAMHQVYSLAALR